MKRSTTTLALALTLTLGMAQDVTIVERETDDMKANALQRTELVANAVGDLTTEQREQVIAIYMDVERHMDAMKQRYVGHEEDYAADLEPVTENLDAKTESQLTTILNEEQLTKWQAGASKE